MSSEPTPGRSGKPTDQPTSIEKVATGQKLIIYAILVNFLTMGLVAAFGDIAALLGIVAIVLSLTGLMRLGSGLHYSTGKKILLVLLMFVPLISIITLAILNSRATKALRAAGYRVGLLGASR
jgi:hypothetical protein